MADVEARNKQQISIVKAFEAKCKRLYDTRLADYVQKTDEQLSQYEQQLLDAGGQIATERSRFESRQRRLQIACSRWKLEYQKELHSKVRSSLIHSFTHLLTHSLTLSIISTLMLQPTWKPSIWMKSLSLWRSCLMSRWNCVT